MAPDTAWRPVLQAGDGRPVVIRSSLTHTPPLAACSLLLENGNPAHRALLGNLIAFCAGGLPGTIVLGGPGSPWAGTLVRKLRLRRVNAIRPPRESRGARAGRSHRRPPSAAIELDPAHAELHYQRWVARRWSSWLQTGAGEARHTSVMATRAYLRTLAALEQELDGELWHLGLPNLARHAPEVLDLVNRQLGDRDNLEGTIGATAAVVELDELVPGAIGADRIEGVRNWLRKAAVTAGVRDRLEIARVLHDRKLLTVATDDLRRPVSASTIVRLRRAAIACESTDLSFVLDDTDRDAILAEIVTSLLAAAEYLRAHEGISAVVGEGWIV